MANDVRSGVFVEQAEAKTYTAEDVRNFYMEGWLLGARRAFEVLHEIGIISEQLRDRLIAVIESDDMKLSEEELNAPWPFEEAEEK